MSGETKDEMPPVSSQLRPAEPPVAEADPNVTLAPAAVHSPLDPRRNAFRADLADEALKDRIDAPRYSPGVLRQVIRPSVPMRRAPEARAPIDTEILYGETVRQFDEVDGWSWVQLSTDGYVGYVPADTLTADVVQTTHRVKALGTFLYPAPDIKSPPLAHLSINARLAIAERGEKLSRTAGGHFVVTRHVSEWHRYERDFVDIAERLVGTPYLWGGRTRVGLDCSGLVQTALLAAGFRAPRDSDMQKMELGSNVLVPADLEGLERGDLVFWNGHVGIMTDSVMFVHANAHHMAVAVETLPEAADRIRKTGSRIVAIKRMKGEKPPAS